MIKTYHIDLKLAPPYDSLHCTLVRWFECDCGENALIAALTPVLGSMMPRILYPERFDRFGIRSDILVTRVSLFPHLYDAHHAACDAVDMLGGKSLEPQWSRSGYNPHVTALGDLRLPEGGYVVATDARLRWVPDPAGMTVERVVIHSWPIPRR